jgi:hypothetical protein
MLMGTTQLQDAEDQVQRPGHPAFRKIWRLLHALPRLSARRIRVRVAGPGPLL